jgi:CheY-like chemotaxis protein
VLSGREVMKKLDEDFDLILLDISFPNANGWKILYDIRKNEKTKSIPVVMLTATPLTKEIKRKEILDISDYITKPFSKKDLLETLKQVLKS